MQERLSSYVYYSKDYWWTKSHEELCEYGVCYSLVRYTVGMCNSFCQRRIQFCAKSRCLFEVSYANSWCHFTKHYSSTSVWPRHIHICQMLTPTQKDALLEKHRRLHRHLQIQHRRSPDILWQHWDRSARTRRWPSQLLWVMSGTVSWWSAVCMQQDRRSIHSRRLSDLWNQTERPRS